MDEKDLKLSPDMAAMPQDNDDNVSQKMKLKIMKILQDHHLVLVKMFGLDLNKEKLPCFLQLLLL